MKTGFVLSLAALGLTMAVGCSTATTEQPEQVNETNDAIIGGELETGHPYVVAVGDNSRAFCTGTVIGKHTVLTAGHCYAAGIKAIYISNNVTSTSGATKIAVAQAIRHPGYTTTGGKPSNDLTILKLASEAPMQPAPLFRGTMDNSPTFIGPLFTWVGFGDNVVGSGPWGGSSGFGKKRITHFAINKVGEVGGTQVGGTVGTIDETMFWYQVPGKSMCHGDSGGPAFFVQDGVEHLIGATSFGDPGCGADGVQSRSDAPQIANFIQANLDAFEANDACRSDGSCNESCNSGGQVVDPDCHEAHAAADGVCSQVASPADPDCTATAH
jgi:secreted trypsin-like serine protease